MTAPRSPLPIEARRQAWDRLWQRLLAPLPDDRPSRDEDKLNDLGESDESAEDQSLDEAA
jgi:hypothetical protein